MMSIKRIKRIYYTLYDKYLVPLRWLYFKWTCGFDIKDSSETLDYIMHNNLSVSRYGDGEFMIMSNLSMGFQKANQELADKLKTILASNSDKHISCLPYPMFHQDNLKPQIAQYWKKTISNYSGLLKEICNKSVYYDACFSRFYIDYTDTTAAAEIIKKIKCLWEQRDVYIVEGNSTRFGIGNDFLDNAKSVHRIICPPTNAFDKYDEILQTIKEHIPKDNLILCALGMTATILAYDLSNEGYQAIDIGHADIEYMWYKMGAKERILIPGKAVNELGVTEVSQIVDPNFESQIITTIK